MLLTEKEIRTSFVEACKEAGRDDEMVGSRGVAKAQLEKVLDWGEEDCPHVGHPRGKHWCGECWDSLKEGEK